MNKLEAAKLLTIAAGFDNRNVDDVNTTAWHAALSGLSFADAQRAVIEHQTGPRRHEYLTVAHVFDTVQAMNRASRDQIETDVRSAKARGIVDARWPATDALSAEAALRLRQARAADQVAAAELSSSSDGARSEVLSPELSLELRTVSGL
jgi:hypothetical protein